MDQKTETSEPKAAMMSLDPEVIEELKVAKEEQEKVLRLRGGWVK
jgi:hypothetical protein